MRFLFFSPVRRFAVSSEAMRARIPDYADAVRKHISEELKDRLFCLKIDGMTKYSRSFLGINVQFIKNGEIQVRTLAVKEMFSRHTALNIKQEVVATLDKYNVPIVNILTVKSDSGANIIKVAELLGNDQVQEAETQLTLEEMEPWYPDFDLTSSD